jgi:hypothetical protein
MTYGGESLRRSSQQRMGRLGRRRWFEVQLDHVADAREECTHSLRYVLWFNAMRWTYNNLPVRSRMDPDATLLLPKRSIWKP